jgi:hypothetical protein
MIVKKTRKAYLDAVASGQISQELCGQLLQNSDTDFYKMCLEICNEDMEKYYSAVKKSLEVFSRPKSFLESTETYMKREEILQQAYSIPTNKLKFVENYRKKDLFLLSFFCKYIVFFVYYNTE